MISTTARPDERARMRVARNQPELALRALQTGLQFDPGNAGALELRKALAGTN